jgi:hypothetical protein
MMQRYLVQVPHDPDPRACAKVARVFLLTGSHYLAQADWGCRDGDHTATMIVEAENREEARQIVPPPFRAVARVVLLNKFTIEEIDALMHEHGNSTSS